jgi:hypothetical protein
MKLKLVMMEEFRVDPGRVDLFKMIPTSPGDVFGLPGHGLEVKLETLNLFYSILIKFQ